jgi:hypothetical protein
VGHRPRGPVHFGWDYGGAAAGRTAIRRVTLRLSGGRAADDPLQPVGMLCTLRQFGHLATISRLTVTWPGGAREHFDGLAADRYHRIVEGRMPAAPWPCPRRSPFARAPLTLTLDTRRDRPAPDEEQP